MRARALVLGSGTSTGVPIVGREYPPEFLANPKNHRTRSSLYLSTETTSLLVDVTPDFRTQFLTHGIMRLDAVLITHTHADHIMGMDDLRPFVLQSGAAMPIYAWPEYQEDIRRIFPYAFREMPVGVEVPRYDLQDLGPKLNVGDLSLEIFRVWHGSMPVVAFRIGDFAYITDVSEIPEAEMGRLNGLKTLILDAVRRKPHPNHFHFDKAIEVAQQIGAEITYFTHLSHDFDHDVCERTELPSNIRLAYDGLEVEVTFEGLDSKP